MELQRHGFQMLYYPAACVQHRVIRRQCRLPALRRRAYTFGRGQVRLHGWHRRNLYSKNKTLWTITLAADYLPAFAWGNTVNGARMPMAASTHSGPGYPSGQPGDPNVASVIKENRDFLNDTPKPSYTAFTYPHPLTTNSPPTASATACSRLQRRLDRLQRRPRRLQHRNRRLNRRIHRLQLQLQNCP